MPCCVGCGRVLTSIQMLGHIQDCPKRQKRQWLSREARVQEWTRDRTYSLIGRPTGPRMPCGWGSLALLTEHQMRAHFSRCASRPLIGWCEAKVQQGVQQTINCNI